jgi:hypothetical protein
MALIDSNTNRECVTTSQAVERSGLSREYLTSLLRKGSLEGFQLAREWLIYTDSLDQFLAKNRKPGPRQGSHRKKTTPKPPHTASAVEGDKAERSR